ncbi:hypothetical protein LWI29_030771 [Acer saccharum]|uniref:Uncharacterized protein n=1 Tax=Acer saccharum TaxID=4024 RepID=A0AA39W0Y5_ACESA|nr:hypothetical protein LWI29_030771 [Acer saccharum]
MCMWHMWHRMKRPPPTPREICHFYSLRPVGKTGIYFLQSTQPKLWIPKDVVVKGEIEPTTDEKMKGFDLDGTQMTCRVPRYFCTPQWNHLTSAFIDEELKTLARAVVRPLGKRGKPYLYNEGKMIKARLFPQISARCKRLFEVDVVCDALARRMKAALHQRDAGIAPPEDESDENAPENPPEGDDERGVPDYVPEETQGHGMTACSTEAVGDPEDFGVGRASPDQDSRADLSSKGKEKVGDPSEPEQATFPHGPSSPRSAANMPDVTSQGVEAVRGHSGTVAPEVSTSAEPNPSALEIPTPADPVSTPGGINVEAGQPGKRKASFSSGRPYPKIPRVVAYVDSSSGDEGEGDVEKDTSVAPPEEQIRDSAGGSTDFPRAASSAGLPEVGASGLGSSP